MTCQTTCPMALHNIALRLLPQVSSAEIAAVTPCESPLLVSQRFCWRDLGCASRGHICRQHRHEKHRWHDNDICHNVHAACVEQHGIHELLDGETHRQTDHRSN